MKNHLDKQKNFLRKVLTYRKSLARMNRGKAMTEEMKTFINNMENSIAIIQSSQRMLNYLKRPDIQKYLVEEIIPSNKDSWKTEFYQLLSQASSFHNSKNNQQKLYSKNENLNCR